LAVCRLAAGTALLLSAAGLAACDDDSPDQDATAVTTTVAGEPTTSSVPRIGVRGDLPRHDPAAFAARYGRTDGLVPAARPYSGEPAVGSQREFIVSRITGSALTGESPPLVGAIAATLHATTEHAYFYAEDAIEPDPEEIHEAAARFEEDLWPLVTGIFGEPATPGVDGDPRIIVLQADLGGAVAGYFSPEDTFVQALRPLSNEAEMVYLSHSLRPGGNIYSAVLAHELQHLIHNHSDAGEEAWLNEGLSEAALLLAGGFPSTVRQFQSRPETQLTDFRTDDSQPHYGAGAAFLRYLADRLGGEQALGAIAREQGDGTAAIDAMLAAQGSDLSFRALFADWIAANVLRLEEGPYAAYSVDVTALVEEELAAGSGLAGDAHQFGADYVALADIYDEGEYVLRFRGQTAVRPLPLSAMDGREGALWSNAEDGINTTATYPVDLVDAELPTLSFRTWFDIEPWYDWGYVSVSTDGGASWATIRGEHTLTFDVLEVGLGSGYGGTSGGREEPGWFDEHFDLSPFAGQQILLRFDYVTDSGIHRDGWVVDDVQVDGGGRLGEAVLDGWIPVPASLQQDWIVRLLVTYEDGNGDAIDLHVNGGAGEIQFDTAGVLDAVVVVAGATEGTRQTAQYEVRLDRIE
jgi:hypothetical protein